MTLPRTLEFARGSRYLVAATSSDCLYVASLADRAPRPIACPGWRAFTTAGSELWVAGADGTRLARYALDDGRSIGAVDGLPRGGADARFLHGLGTSLALWVGDDALAQVALDETRVIAVGPPLVGLELAVPVSSTRALVCARGSAALREGGSTRWTTALADGRCIDGAILSDGRAAALVVARAGASTSTLLVLGLRDGALQHRINLAGADAVRFAPRRMVALVLAERRRLLLVDLRFGRILIDQRLDRDVAALAIDEAGQHIALRFDDPYGAVVTITVDELAAAPQLAAGTASHAVVELTAHAAVAEPAAEPLDARVEAPFATAAELRPTAALPARAIAEPTTADETRAVLAAQRDLVIAWTALAIARAWDQGRLAHAANSALPSHDEVEGVIGTLRGLATADVVEGERRVAAAEAELARVLAGVAPRVPPLLRLCDEVALPQLARDLLLVIGAPALWGEVARLYGILANDEDRPLCDEHLAATILADRAPPYEIAGALDASAGLLQSGLVRVRAGALRPFLPLSLDRVALVILRGALPESELQPAIRPYRGSGRSLGDLRIRAAVKEQLAAELARAAAPLRIAVRGRIGSGRHSLLDAIARASGRELGVIDTHAMLRDPQRRAIDLRSALERARFAGLLPCVDLDRIATDDTAGREEIRDVLRWHPGPLALRLAWDAPPPLDPGHILVDLPAPTGAERVAAWTASVAAAALTVASVAELADRYAVGPGVIERVCAQVATAGTADTTDAGNHLDDAVRQHLETRLGTTADRVARLATWSQVVLPPDIQDSLTELIARIRRRRVVFEAWGFDRILSTARGVTALFQGGPGTGKTLVASAIASELGMDLYRVDLSRVMSKWIGETQQNLAKLFDAAEDGNAIILFDEADSLFAKRTEVKTSVDRYANLEVNYLLQRLDTFEGIAILTTNFASSIDTAFKRRLSLRLTFPFPDDEQRERLWRAHLPPETPTSGTLDLAELARRFRLSGGYIRNCALRAAFLAAEECRALSADHLERAIRAEFREIGKLADSGILE